jgi:hypothetical protein
MINKILILITSNGVTFVKYTLIVRVNHRHIDLSYVELLKWCKK